jgi:hypothetical protein
MHIVVTHPSKVFVVVDIEADSERKRINVSRDELDFDSPRT